jgi:signal transduction histidine kinase
VQLITLGQGHGLVEVRDEGPGIPHEHLARVFDKFFSLPGGAGQKKGSGLELYIVRRVVEAHGGQVWAESDLERGCMIGFRIPLSVVAKG